MKKGIGTVLGWHGGKHYMAKHIHALAEPFRWSKTFKQGWLHRVHPFAGGLAEFWDWDERNTSEVINDIDGRLYAFYRTLSDAGMFEKFKRLVELWPVSQRLWEKARDFFGGFRAAGDTGDTPPEEVAFYLFVLVRQSMSKRGDTFTPLSKTRTRRGMNEQTSAWLSSVEGLPEAHRRMQKVVILNEDFGKVIKTQDGPNTLFYCDPTYLDETRTAPDVYEHEMTPAQHEQFLKAVVNARGYVLVSGYDSRMYNDYLTAPVWRKYVYPIANHSAKGKKKRVMNEIIWMKAANGVDFPA